MYQYLAYLPPELREIREFQAIGHAIDLVADTTYEYTAQKYLNQFIMTSDIPTLERWERIFQIVPYPDDTVETRRLRIISKFMAQLPFTWRVLHEYLDVFSDNYEPTRDFEIQHFGLSISLRDNLKLSELVSSLRLLIPANMTMMTRVKERTAAPVVIGAAPRSGVTIRVRPYQAGSYRQTAKFTIGAIGAAAQTIRIQPKGDE